MPEVNILAYFPTSTSAKKAAEEIKDIGVEDIQVSRISRFYNEGGAGDIRTGSLVKPVLNSEIDPPGDSGVLPGADTTASGLSADEHFQVGGDAFLLVVVSEEKKREKIIDIINKYEGLV